MEATISGIWTSSHTIMSDIPCQRLSSSHLPPQQLGKYVVFRRSGWSDVIYIKTREEKLINSLYEPSIQQHSITVPLHRILSRLIDANSWSRPCEAYHRVPYKREIIPNYTCILIQRWKSEKGSAKWCYSHCSFFVSTKRRARPANFFHCPKGQRKRLRERCSFVSPSVFAVSAVRCQSLF